MNKLFDLQKQFQNYLIANKNLFELEVTSTPKVPAKQRIMIYKNAYEERLLEALRYNYPTVVAYLGESKFNELGIKYIYAHPSTYRSIRWFGDKLPSFLHQYYVMSENEYIVELAHLEWCFTLAFDSPDVSLLKANDLEMISPYQWPNLCLHFHPSVFQFSFIWNVIELWKFFNNEKSLKQPIKISRAYHWILWRNKESVTQFCSVTEEEAMALKLARSGTNFGCLCEMLCQLMKEEEAPLYAASLLKSWLMGGLIVGMEFKEESNH